MRRLSPLARVVCTAAMVSVSEREFRRLAAGAVQSGTTLDFSGKTVMLSEPLKVEQDQVLRVVGGSIAGDGHSVFQAGGGRSGLLSLTDVEISHHASPERQEKRSLGAAVFGRGKARVSPAPFEPGDSHHSSNEDDSIVLQMTDGIFVRYGLCH